MPEETLSLVIRVLEALAILALGIGGILIALRLKRFEKTVSRLDRALGEIARNSGPVLDRARAIGENVNYVATRVRKNVDEASEVVSRTNRRIEDALESVETRVRELDAVIGVVQDEVEETLLSAGSALRGLRTGAEALASRRDRHGSERGSEREPEPSIEETIEEETDRIRR